MRLIHRQALLGLLFACLGPAALAQGRLEGAWKTVDDHSGQVRAIVRMVEVDGEFQGRIEKVFPQPGEDPHPRCEECSGPRHNQPLEGMVIVERLRREGEDYVGGSILDPETGTTYRCRMSLADKGTRLMVRGYVGLALFGRTQIWQRAEP